MRVRFLCLSTAVSVVCSGLPCCLMGILLSGLVGSLPYVSPDHAHKVDGGPSSVSTVSTTNLTV